MEAALESGNLVEVITHLSALISSCPDQDKDKLLCGHRVNGKPTLHHLASVNYSEDDVPHLDKLIKIFIASGYNVDGDLFPVRDGRFYCDCFTALLASIFAKNQVFLESLLRNGARPDVCSETGFSACHVAIKMKDLKSLQTLIKFGGTSILATTSREYVRPLLHTAVEEGHEDILVYLLSKPEFGMDVRQTAVYNGGTEFTPLELAFEEGGRSVIRIILDALYKDSNRFTELYLHLMTGDTQMATELVSQFSSEELARDKIEGKWALHWLGSAVFHHPSRVEFTKKLILEYVRSGWNVNSESRSYLSISVNCHGRDIASERVDRCTLLHLACLDNAKLEMIKWLVEDLGAEVNCKTEGDLELTPLLILIARGDWEGAEYLIEKGADLNVKGIFGDLRISSFMTRNEDTGKWEPFSRLNAVEFLLRLKSGEGFQLLDKLLLSPDYVWSGVDEFHLALEGRNPRYVGQVLKIYGGLISNQDLLWITASGKGTTPEIIPSLHYLLWGLNLDEALLEKEDVDGLLYTVEIMLRAGLDLSLVWKDTSIFNIFQLGLSRDSGEQILDFLGRLLKIKELPLNSTWLDQSELVYGIQDRMGEYCYDFKIRCTDNPNRLAWPIPATQLLITHGLDMSGMETGYQFMFHFGCTPMYKMMIAAGLRTLDEFWKIFCKAGGNNAELANEFVELKVWKEGFDRKEAGSLKHLCRLKIRKSIEFVKHLEKLDRMPKQLQDYILCRNYV